MSAQGEIWRVSTVEGVFEADLDTLKQWIAEGCVLPTDKVSKGNLNWIEAGRAPMLRASFNGEVGSSTVVIATTDASTQSAQSAQPPSYSPDPLAADAHEEASCEHEVPATPPLGAIAAGPSACHNHPEASAKYICRICASTFCAECPKFAGGVSKVALCPLCGDFCRLIEEERSKFQRQEFQTSGFGFADFTRAVRYPLQHKVALLFGAALYGFLLLAGFRGKVVAFVIMFGCIAHVINQVAWGKLECSFLPDFSSFSLWDDLAVPIGLGVGITIVTWGPVIAIVLALFFGVIKGGASMSPLNVPTAPSAQEGQMVMPEDLGALTDPNADPKKLEEANNKLNRLRPGSQIAREAERSKQQQSDPLADVRFILGFVHIPLLLILLVIGIVWGVFYGPMALAVAGYTEDLGSVLNPLVGLDTIRRMGATYFKAFGMVILIQFVGFVVTVVVGLILSPFDLPFVGNLPARFVDGSVTFYFNLVVACILGLSLHKCADRLGIGVEQG